MILLLKRVGRCTVVLRFDVVVVCCQTYAAQWRGGYWCNLCFSSVARLFAMNFYLKNPPFLLTRLNT